VQQAQGITQNGAKVLKPTFEHFMYFCTKLKLCAFKTPLSAIPKPLTEF
jgi:hypothetical protein